MSWWFHPQVPNTNSFLSRQLSMSTTTQRESAFMPPLLCSCHCIHLECSPPRQTLPILCNYLNLLLCAVFWNQPKAPLPLLSARTISVCNLLAKNHLSSTKLNSSIVVLIYYLNQEEFPPFSQSLLVLSPLWEIRIHLTVLGILPPYLLKSLHNVELNCKVKLGSL